VPTSREAIERFLRWRMPPAPPVKDMADADLYSLILQATGIPYQPTTPPRRQQLVGQAFLAVQNNGLMFFGMRTGKTKLILDRFAHLRKMGMMGKGGIIVPNPVVRPVWVSEAALHTPELTVREVANDPMEFVDALEDASDLIVMSWSSLQAIFCNKKKGRGGSELVEDIELLKMAAPLFSFGAMDEIHGAKNSASIRYSIARHLFSQTDSRIGCTGTPFGRDAYALWPQAYLVDRGACLGQSQHFFREAYGKKQNNHFAPRGHVTVFDEDKADLLAERMQPLALSYTMQECGIVQTKPKVVKLRMTKDQQRHYREAAQGLVEASGAEQKGNAFVRLRMISSGYVPFMDEDGKQRTAELPSSPKLAWLEDMAVLHSGAKVVVFHEYEESGRIISAMLKKHKVKHAWLYGGAKDKAGQVAKFRSGAVDWFLVNNQSGNAGIDLRAADWQVFYESSTSPIIRQQAEARAMGDRGGRSFYMDDLICSKIEERILTFHQEGRDLLESIVYRMEDLV
jgi:hypothetical protein